MMLELRDIYKTYLQGKLEVPVLGGISLSVEEGEYLAIMGPSGSGKTTLMNIIGCLDSATSGEYILEGENIAGISEKRMSEVRLKSIGFVFQSFYLLSRQSALDNVALPLLYSGVRRKERQQIARRALERVGLGDRTDFKPTQLSGGQCQRVAIARAIVNSPKILLADEPTGALDTRSGEQIMEIFKSLNQEGVTIVMITHEPEIAAHARRTLHIRDGLLVGADGRPLEQRPRPAGTAPAASLAGTPLPNPSLVKKPKPPKAPKPPKEQKQPRRPAAPRQPEPAPQPAAPAQQKAQAAPQPQKAPEPQAAAKPPVEEQISGQTIIAALERQLEQLKEKQGPAGPAEGEGPADEK